MGYIISLSYLRYKSALSLLGYKGSIVTNFRNGCAVKPLDKEGRAPMAEAARYGVLSIYAQAIQDLHDNGSPEARAAASSLARFVADKAVTSDADNTERPPKAPERSEAGWPPSTRRTDGTSAAAEGATHEVRSGKEAPTQDRQLQELQDMLNSLRNERALREMLAKAREGRQSDRKERKSR